MAEQDPTVTELVARMKDTARARAWIPLGTPLQECYYHFRNGLSLCMTVDILPEGWVKQVARLSGVEVPEALDKGGKYWHLSIARVGAGSPLPAEVEFWRGAFFEEPPFIQTGGVLPGVNSQHFFWKYIL